VAKINKGLDAMKNIVEIVGRWCGILVLILVGVVLGLAMQGSARAQDHSYPALAQVSGAYRAGATVEELCNPAFKTKTVRPSAAHTNVLKKALFQAMQAAGDIPIGVGIEDYELDHCVPLTNGGHPGIVMDGHKVDIVASERVGNLRMQPRVTFFEKESLREGSPWFGLDQPYPAAEMKDFVEVRTHKLMCAGPLSLTQARVLSCEAWQYFYGCAMLGMPGVCEMVDKIKAAND
jgi:hypothetical protein